MDRLISILRAAHCRSTHQFFVIDALPLITTPGGQRLGSQMLRHYKRYLTGSKAPDTDFRDFRNHVLHVQDKHWGGAPKKAEEWYRHLLRKIREGEWSDAAYCAGVLSHYFTDPLMPLHTAQSKKESIVHRPLEWSVTKSYERILQRYQAGRHKIVFQLANNDGWLSDAVTKGAELSNRYYDSLIDQYDLERGVKDPESGFNESSIDVLAGLFGVALTGWARIIEIAAEESAVQIPEASLSMSELVASITMPIGWLVRRIETKSEQKAVRAILEEYRATGTVVENLPPEVTSVSQERKRDLRLERDRARATIKPRASSTPTKVPQTATATLPFQAPAEEATTERKPSTNLSLTDDLVDAPSIGPKTAKRFVDIGIHTVEQFLAGDPAEIAAAINTGWIKTDTIVDWQDQARLVVEVPGLCGYKSQLLVGVECRTRETLASQDASALHEKISSFANTSAGKRVLRSNRLPSQDDIQQWVQNAAAEQVRRTA